MSERGNQDERVSTIGGDRLCSGCGFNLFGQPVTRDAGTGLMLSRCPECGAAAALQEYPGPFRALKWLTGALIALWLFVLLGMVAGTVGVITGSAVAMREVTIEETSVEIGKQHAKWFVETKQEQELQKQVAAGTMTQAARQQIVQQVQGGGWGWAQVTDSWWDGVDQQGMISWPWTGDREKKVMSAYMGVMLIIGVWMCGVLLATAMPGVRGVRRVVLVLIVCGVACAIFELVVLTSSVRGWKPTGGYTSARELAYQIVPQMAGFAMIAGLSGVLAVGVCTGRSVSRWVIRGVLPHRLAAQLHVLWEADGLIFRRK